MRKKWPLICIEGIDQSGKKTQWKLLAKKLKAQGFQVEKTSFPDYSTPIGREIKAFLHGKRDYNVHVRHILYAANRWERKENIEKWLINNIVLLNRYFPSNLAYGTANGLTLDWLLNLENGLPSTDLVIILDIDPEASFKRKRLDRDIFEKNLTYLRTVRNTYVQLSKRFHWVLVDGEKSIKNVHEEIWKRTTEYFTERTEQELT